MLYVHVLHLRDIEHVRAEVLRLEVKVLEAFGSQEAIDEARRQLARCEADLREARP